MTTRGAFLVRGGAGPLALLLALTTAADADQLPAGEPSDEAAAPPAGPGVEPRLVAPRDRGPSQPPEPRDHRHQLGLSLSVPIGLRVISTYDGEFCGDTSPDTATGNSPVCAGRAPFSIDLTASYGLLARFEIIAELRLGLERDFAATRFDPSGTGPRVYHLAPGVRAMYSDAGTSKVFSTAQVVLDFSSYGDDRGGTLGTDLGVRNLNGMQFDLGPRWGFYGYVGETVSFTRWIRLEIEAGVGIQGRLP